MTVFLTAFGDELVKLAQEVPLPTERKTKQHREAEARYGPVDETIGPTYVDPNKGYGLRTKPGTPEWFRRERKANPWMRDPEQWKKYHKKTRRGSLAVEYGSTDRRFGDWTRMLDQRERDTIRRWRQRQPKWSGVPTPRPAGARMELLQ